MSLPSALGPDGECSGEFHTASAGHPKPQDAEPKTLEPKALEPEAQSPNPAKPLAQETPVQEFKGNQPQIQKSQGEQVSELRLDQFLKWQGLVGTGGEAKFRIQQGDVQVNGALEQRRGRKLQPGDRVRLAGQELVVPPFQARR